MEKENTQVLLFFPASDLMGRKPSKELHNTVENQEKNINVHIYKYI